MKTQIVIDIDHHAAVSVKDRLLPVIEALMAQAYAVNQVAIDVTENE